MANSFNLVLLYNKLGASTAVVHDLKNKDMNVLALDKAVDLANMLKDRSRHIDMIGLSANHPQATNFLEILKSNDQIKIFAFIEESSPDASKRLASCPVNMKVNGVGSGYTIWMTIGNYVKEKMGDDVGGKVIVHGSTQAKTGMGAVQTLSATENHGGLGAVQSVLGNVGGPAGLGGIHVTTGPDLGVDGGGGTLVLREESKAQKPEGKITSESSKKLKTSCLRVLVPFRGRDVADTDKYKPAKRIFAIQISYEEEKGLFLFCSNNGDLTLSDIDKFKKNIAQEMGSRPFTIGDTHAINIDVENICKWAKKTAQFALVFKDKVDTMMCYIKCGQVMPEFTKTENTEMSSFDIKVLPVQASSLFEIYLYLNKNEKLVPYFKQGEEVGTDQIQKLHQKGIKEVYIKDTDKAKLNMLVLASKLNPLFRAPLN